MTDIWPSTLVPRKIRVGRRGGSRTGGISAGESEQIITNGSGLITVRMSEFPVATDDAILTWEGVSARLDGRNNCILIRLYQLGRPPFPNGLSEAHNAPIPHSDGSLFSDGSGYSQSAIEIYGQPAPTMSTLIFVSKEDAGEIRPGHYFSMRDGEVHRVARVIEQSATSARIQINPPLRAAITQTTRLEFVEPLLKARLATDDEMALDLEIGRFDFPTINFIEVN